MNYQRASGITVGALFLASLAGMATRAMVNPGMQPMMGGNGSSRLSHSGIPTGHRDALAAIPSNTRGSDNGLTRPQERSQTALNQTPALTGAHEKNALSGMGSGLHLTGKPAREAKSTGAMASGKTANANARSLNYGLEKKASTLAKERKSKTGRDGSRTIVASARLTQTGASDSRRVSKGVSYMANAGAATQAITKAASAAAISKKALTSGVSRATTSDQKISALSKATKTKSTGKKDTRSNTKSGKSATTSGAREEAASVPRARVAGDGVPMMNLLRGDRMAKTQEETLPFDPKLARAHKAIFGTPEKYKEPVRQKDQLSQNAIVLTIRDGAHQHVYQFKGKVLCGTEACESAKLHLRMIAPGTKVRESFIPVQKDGSYNAQVAVYGDNNDQIDWALYATGDQGVRKEIGSRAILLDDGGYVYEHTLQLEAVREK